MELEEIRARIKQMIRKITNLKEDRIGDDVSFRRELKLDSLTLMEIGVDVDHEFKLGLADEEMAALDSVEQTAQLVVRKHAARASG